LIREKICSSSSSSSSSPLGDDAEENFLFSLSTAEGNFNLSFAILKWALL
jgi:hypothetical protein